MGVPGHLTQVPYTLDRIRKFILGLFKDLFNIEYYNMYKLSVNNDSVIVSHCDSINNNTISSCPQFAKILLPCSPRIAYLSD